MELQVSLSTAEPGQVFPFRHMRFLCLNPPWQDLLQADQLLHEAQVAAVGKKQDKVENADHAMTYPIKIDLDSFKFVWLRKHILLVNR